MIYLPAVQDLFDSRDVSGLCRLLLSAQETTVRSQAARALGALLDVSATEALMQAAHSDSQADVRSSASHALDELLGPQNAREAYRLYTQSVDAEAEPTGGGASSRPYSLAVQNFVDHGEVEALIGLLLSPSSAEIRAEAALALGDLGDYQAVEALLRAAHSPGPRAISSAALQALDRLLGPANARAALDVYAQNEPDDLPDLPPPPDPQDAGLETLIQTLLHDPDPDARYNAALDLGDLGRLESSEALLQSAAQDTDEEVREAAFEALTDLLGEEAAGDALEKFTPNLDQTVPAIPSLPADPHGWSISGLATVLAGEPDPELRRKAVRVLAQIASPAAVDLLADAAIGGDEAVRSDAEQALRALYGEEADALLADHRALRGLDQDEASSESAGEQIEVQVPPARRFQTGQEPVVQEDSSTLRFFLFAGLALAVLITLYALLR